MRPYTVHDASFWEDASWILRKGLRTLWNHIIDHASIHGTWRVLLRGCVLNSTKRSTNLVKPYNSPCVHTRYMTRPFERMRPEFYEKVYEPSTPYNRSCVHTRYRKGLRTLWNRIIHHASIHGTWRVLLRGCVLNSTERSTNLRHRIIDHATIIWGCVLIKFRMVQDATLRYITAEWPT